MDRDQPHPKDHAITTYLDKRTGRVTMKPLSETDNEDHSFRDDPTYDPFESFDVPTIHSRIDSLTGKITTMITTIHPDHGGYARTSIRTSNLGEPCDMSSMFEYSKITPIPGGLRHTFRMRQHPTSSPQTPETPVNADQRDHDQTTHPELKLRRTIRKRHIPHSKSTSTKSTSTKPPIYPPPTEARSVQGN